MHSLIVQQVGHELRLRVLEELDILLRFLTEMRGGIPAGGRPANVEDILESRSIYLIMSDNATTED